MNIAPSSTKLYFESIKNFFNRNPILLKFDVLRERITNTEGFIEIDSELKHGFRFIFFEYYSVKEGVINYRYQLLDKNHESIVRWDNAPHHPELDNFPHHKHIRKQVQSCKKLSIYQIFNQINEYLI